MARFGFLVFAIACAANLAAAPGAALAQTPTPSGGRDVFSVSDCADPITLRFVGAIKPAAIRTGDIAPRPAASPPGWTIEWDKPAADDIAIGEYVSAGHFKDGCPGPGLYSVPLTVYGEDHSEGPLALTVVRVVDPVLDIPASVTLSAERLWGEPDPVPLLLREIIAGAPDARISVLGSELKTAAGEATGIALEPRNGTVLVKAGESARVMLAPTDAPAPGAYTARLVLNGAAVKPGTTIDVTYKVRVASYYLLVVIALGIALGLLVNVYLAGRAALDAALLTGLQAMQALTRRATPQRDPRGAATPARGRQPAAVQSRGRDQAGRGDQAGRRGRGAGQGHRKQGRRGRSRAAAGADRHPQPVPLERAGSGRAAHHPPCRPACGSRHAATRGRWRRHRADHGAPAGFLPRSAGAGRAARAGVPRRCADGAAGLGPAAGRQ